MMMTIYKRAFNVLMKKPVKLWGISLLSMLLTSVLSALCGATIPLLGLAVGLLLSTAMTIIFLRGYRGEDVNTLQLFDCFKSWDTAKRVLLGLGWMYLWVFIWGLIPIVGPIFALIRIYEYRLTPYILVFEPDVPVTDAIRISKARTEGHKLQMWLADFVFIVAIWVAAFILGLLSVIPFIGILFALVTIALTLASVAFGPLFLGLVQAAFYEEINTKRTDRYCPHCGTPAVMDASYCPGCGAPTE